MSSGTFYTMDAISNSSIRIKFYFFCAVLLSLGVFVGIAWQSIWIPIALFIRVAATVESTPPDIAIITFSFLTVFLIFFNISLKSLVGFNKPLVISSFVDSPNDAPEINREIYPT